MAAVTALGGVAVVAANAQTGLVADVQYLEQFGSSALNRKAFGIFGAGVYRGYTVVPGTGLNVTVNPDGTKPGVASVNVDNFQITVQLLNAQTVALAAGKTNFVILEAVYGQGVLTKQVDSTATQEAALFRVVYAESDIPVNAIEIARITLAAGAKSVAASQIDITKRYQYLVAYEPTDDIHDTRETRLLTVKAGKSFLPLAGGTVTGALTLDSTLDVKGGATFQGDVKADGNGYFNRVRGVYGIDVGYDSGASNTRQLNFYSASDNTLTGYINVVGGSLTASYMTVRAGFLQLNGALSTNGTFSAAGAVSIGDSLTVTGATALASTLAVGGNVTANGYGAFTSSGMSLLIKPATKDSTYYLRGQKYDATNHWYLGQGSASTDVVTLQNHLTASFIDLDANLVTLGASTVNATGALSVAGNTALSGTLNVSGISYFGSSLRAARYLDLGYQSTDAASTQITFYSGAASTKTGAIVVSGSTLSTSTMAIQAGGITTTGALSIGDSLTVSKAAAFAGDITVAGSAILSGNMTSLATATELVPGPNTQYASNNNRYMPKVRLAGLTGNGESLMALQGYSYSTAGFAPGISGTRSMGTLGNHGQMSKGKNVFTLMGSASDGADYQTLGRIDFYTSEDTTATGSGGEIRILTTPKGTTTPTTAAIFGNDGSLTVSNFGLFNANVNALILKPQTADSSYYLRGQKVTVLPTGI
ncbi:hypothetical protein O3W44_22175 [Pantoea sp. LMR881]|uniref:hypothetical protein n=1 Tax=Pantoea sp. LMR881 TaxID=3014336 RepID=UPI0022AF7E0E|nr:hypothetical protein [Pantoea sp. LMR881]MCZ4061240.1 hypothetical protein [Pantoea sp. LMR881]